MTVEGAPFLGLSDGDVCVAFVFELSICCFIYDSLDPNFVVLIYVLIYPAHWGWMCFSLARPLSSCFCSGINRDLRGIRGHICRESRCGHALLRLLSRRKKVRMFLKFQFRKSCWRFELESLCCASVTGCSEATSYRYLSIFIFAFRN